MSELASESGSAVRPCLMTGPVRGPRGNVERRVRLDLCAVRRGRGAFSWGGSASEERA
jgi:hypothetical protein